MNAAAAKRAADKNVASHFELRRFVHASDFGIWFGLVASGLCISAFSGKYNRKATMLGATICTTIAGLFVVFERSFGRWQRYQLFQTLLGTVRSEKIYFPPGSLPRKSKLS
jgi:hypothetical protein